MGNASQLPTVCDLESGRVDNIYLFTRFFNRQHRAENSRIRVTASGRGCVKTFQNTFDSRDWNENHAPTQFFAADYTSTSRFYVATQTSKRRMRFYTL